MNDFDTVIHGGPDALGVPAHDFSTNANAAGPCPQALSAIAAADATRYPDPAYTRLRAQLAQFHGVAPSRILLAASASEFIFRISAAVASLGGTRVSVPRPGYGDYARAARAHGMALVAQDQARLVWLCDPVSPTGETAPAPAAALLPGAAVVADRAYAPLRLQGDACDLPGAWALWTPNKALGLTGLRAAYAVAPPGPEAARLAARMQLLLPSWPIGAHGVALLASWTEPAVQQWLAHSRERLREWKQAQRVRCEALGWHVLPGDASFFCARPAGVDVAALLAHLRAAHGIKLRDAASLGLPGHVRMNVLPPASQAAFFDAACATLAP